MTKDGQTMLITRSTVSPSDAYPTIRSYLKSGAARPSGVFDLSHPPVARR